MLRLILALITIPLLSFIMSPFVMYLLQARGTFAYYIAETNLLNWLGISAIFSALALFLLVSIYRFLH